MGEAVKDLVICIVVVAALGLLWLISGGYNRTIEDRINVSVTDVDGKPTGGTNQNNAGTNPPNTQTPPNENPNLSATQYANIPNKSPYFKLITLARAYSGDAKPESEYLTLTTTYSLKKNIVITGWTVHSTSTGRSVSIGKAVYLPTSQSVGIAGEDPVVMRPGDKAYVVSGRAPTGKSFLVNKCSGYFSQFQSYTPSLSYSCPQISRDPLPQAPNQLKDACLTYIESFPQCKTPVDSLPQNIGQECQNFIIEHANYSKCIEIHKTDTDFYSNEWRIYLGQSEKLWKTSRETLELLDASGKVVDRIEY